MSWTKNQIRTICLSLKLAFTISVNKIVVAWIKQNYMNCFHSCVFQTQSNIMNQMIYIKNKFRPTTTINLAIMFYSLLF